MDNFIHIVCRVNDFRAIQVVKLGMEFDVGATAFLEGEHLLILANQSSLHEQYNKAFAIVTNTHNEVDQAIKETK